MRSRCFNRRDRNYRAYGGRGIKVCRRWVRFENFLADMGRRPSKNHSIDRKRNDRGYTPRNCRWATRRQQQSNVRSNLLLKFRGKTQTLAQWAREVGMLSRTIRYRIVKMKWSVAKALTTPYQRKRTVHAKPDR